MALFCPDCHKMLSPNKGWAGQFYDGYCNHCDTLVEDGIDIDGVMGDEDYFYKNGDCVLMEYLNPDANAGKQFVLLTLRADTIREAMAHTSGVEDFFAYIESIAPCELIDEGTPEFDQEVNEWENNSPSFTGRNEASYKRLVEFAKN